MSEPTKRFGGVRVLVGFVAAQHLVFYCSVCSSNNDFSLPLWYLQTFLIPV